MKLLAARGKTTHVAVEGHLADLDEREVLVRPDLGDIKDGAAVGLGLLGLHHLDVELPLGVVTTQDGLEEVLVVEVGVDTSHASGLLRGEVVGAQDRFKVELAVAELAVVAHQLEGVNTEAGHAACGLGQTTRAEDVHQGVDTLGLVAVEIPVLDTQLIRQGSTVIMMMKR